MDTDSIHQDSPSPAPPSLSPDLLPLTPSLPASFSHTLHLPFPPSLSYESERFRAFDEEWYLRLLAPKTSESIGLYLILVQRDSSRFSSHVKVAFTLMPSTSAPTTQEPFMVSFDTDYSFQQHDSGQKNWIQSSKMLDDGCWIEDGHFTVKVDITLTSEEPSFEVVPRQVWSPFRNPTISPELNTSSPLASSVYAIPIQRHDEISADVFVGLTNQGATCYLNSLLQALFHTGLFRWVVYHIPSEPRQDFSSSSSSSSSGYSSLHARPTKRLALLSALQRLFYNLQTSTSAVSTVELTRAFGWSQYESFIQNDVGEMKRKLFEKIQDKIEFSSFGRALPLLYEGSIMISLHCRNISFERVREEKIWDVQLEVKNCESVEDALDRYTEGEIMEGENKWNTEQFGMQDAVKETRFLSLPPVLSLQLMRWEYSPYLQNFSKLSSSFTFPMTLSLAHYVATPSPKQKHDIEKQRKKARKEERRKKYERLRAQNDDYTSSQNSLHSKSKRKHPKNNTHSHDSFSPKPPSPSGDYQTPDSPSTSSITCTSVEWSEMDEDLRTAFQPILDNLTLSGGGHTLPQTSPSIKHSNNPSPPFEQAQPLISSFVPNAYSNTPVEIVETEFQGTGMQRDPTNISTLPFPAASPSFSSSVKLGSAPLTPSAPHSSMLQFTTSLHQATSPSLGMGTNLPQSSHLPSPTILSSSTQLPPHSLNSLVAEETPPPTTESTSFHPYSSHPFHASSPSPYVAETQVQPELPEDQPAIPEQATDQRACCLYTLHSILVHSGSSLSGHYFAFIAPKPHPAVRMSLRNCDEWIERNDDVDWFCFNDGRVRRVPKDEVRQSSWGRGGSNYPSSSIPCAYFLFYIRADVAEAVLCQTPTASIPRHIEAGILADKARQNLIKIRIWSETSSHSVDPAVLLARRRDIQTEWVEEQKEAERKRRKRIQENDTNQPFIPSLLNDPNPFFSIPSSLSRVPVDSETCPLPPPAYLRVHRGSEEAVLPASLFANTLTSFTSLSLSASTSLGALRSLIQQYTGIEEDRMHIWKMTESDTTTHSNNAKGRRRGTGIQLEGGQRVERMMRSNTESAIDGLWRGKVLNFFVLEGAPREEEIEMTLERVNGRKEEKEKMQKLKEEEERKRMEELRQKKIEEQERIRKQKEQMEKELNERFSSLFSNQSDSSQAETVVREETPPSSPSYSPVVSGEESKNRTITSFFSPKKSSIDPKPKEYVRTVSPSTTSKSESPDLADSMISTTQTQPSRTPMTSDPSFATFIVSNQPNRLSSFATQPMRQTAQQTLTDLFRTSENRDSPTSAPTPLSPEPEQRVEEATPRLPKRRLVSLKVYNPNTPFWTGVKEEEEEMGGEGEEEEEREEKDEIELFFSSSLSWLGLAEIDEEFSVAELKELILAKMKEKTASEGNDGDLISPSPALFTSASLSCLLWPNCQDWWKHPPLKDDTPLSSLTTFTYSAQYRVASPAHSVFIVQFVTKDEEGRLEQRRADELEKERREDVIVRCLVEEDEEHNIERYPFMLTQQLYPLKVKKTLNQLSFLRLLSDTLSHPLNQLRLRRREWKDGHDITQPSPSRKDEPISLAFLRLDEKHETALMMNEDPVPISEGERLYFDEKDCNGRQVSELLRFNSLSSVGGNLPVIVVTMLEEKLSDYGKKRHVRIQVRDVRWPISKRVLSDSGYLSNVPLTLTTSLPISFPIGATVGEVLEAVRAKLEEKHRKTGTTGLPNDGRREVDSDTVSQLDDLITAKLDREGRRRREETRRIQEEYERKRREEARREQAAHINRLQSQSRFSTSSIFDHMGSAQAARRAVLDGDRRTHSQHPWPRQVNESSKHYADNDHHSNVFGSSDDESEHGGLEDQLDELDESGDRSDDSRTEEEDHRKHYYVHTERRKLGPSLDQERRRQHPLHYGYGHGKAVNSHFYVTTRTHQSESTDEEEEEEEEEDSSQRAVNSVLVYPHSDNEQIIDGVDYDDFANSDGAVDASEESDQNDSPMFAGTRGKGDPREMIGYQSVRKGKMMRVEVPVEEDDLDEMSLSNDQFDERVETESDEGEKGSESSETRLRGGRLNEDDDSTSSEGAVRRLKGGGYDELVDLDEEDEEIEYDEEELRELRERQEEQERRAMRREEVYRKALLQYESIRREEQEGDVDKFPMWTDLTQHPPHIDSSPPPLPPLDLSTTPLRLVHSVSVVNTASPYSYYQSVTPSYTVWKIARPEQKWDLIAQNNGAVVAEIIPHCLAALQSVQVRWISVLVSSKMAIPVSFFVPFHLDESFHPLLRRVFFCLSPPLSLDMFEDASITVTLNQNQRRDRLDVSQVPDTTRSERSTLFHNLSEVVVTLKEEEKPRIVLTHTARPAYRSDEIKIFD
ncbi:putative Ubiquitin C-terminal hydrolase 12 [Blattamonas nauphoetae]|uniref:Ubiquitin C-terminal hydrolase 12 n=1 Tax=Blattamonas nauphoetae TaxID=2049346 RepID=A0ABQ9XI36_9EUKA|nr:putative Ubiquitin C-terminal hydrolase 12 [Blattamonas nauphoetae]